MTSNLNSIIERVQKLLRVAERSDKPGEVEAAQSRAQEIITKYQIEEAQLNNHVGSGGIIGKRIDVPGKYAIDRIILLNSIAKHNFCKVLRGDNYCMIYGYASDIDLCVALYDSLVIHMVAQMQQTLDSIKKSSKDKLSTKSWVSSFFGGYAFGISERIEKTKSKVIIEVESQTGSSVALVIADKQHAIEEYYQNLTTHKPRYRTLSSSDGYNAGIASADEADLNQTSLEV